MFKFDTTYRVRYSDTDKMGYMYYGHYSRLYEIARVESLRSLGIRYRDLEDEGIIMPVYENKSKYFVPARYDDLLTIRIFLRSLPSKRIVFDYEIFNEEEKLIHVGETTLVFFDQKKEKVVATPQIILNVLEPFFKE
ncbi:MAG: acyl-CoA thioesterase [Cytophagales bacterium]|nr:acyl-CoA thioesterase [Cytophagales bacterium]